MISKAIWNTVRVGDIAKVISGYAFKSNEFQKRGISVIKIKNIRKGFVDLTDAQHVDKKFLSLNEKYHVKYGDLLISLTGSHLTQPDSVVGRVALQNHSHGQCLLNQRAGKIIITDPLKCNSRYLFYTLSYEDIARSIALMAHGAASQANVSPTQIESLKISLPTLITQRKIASILSAYDDLIEKNNRRIKILEEMAQTIYKEWFVNFRFPGHKKVKIVDSELGKIPEGWEVKKLGKIIELLYGKALKKADRIPGHYPVYGSSGIVGYHNEYLVQAPGIIVGRKGNVGSVFWSQEKFYPIDTVFFVRTNIDLYYVFYVLKESNFINNDAAVPGLNRNQAYLNNFLLPLKEIAFQFRKIIEPIFNQIESLQSKIENLKRTRDLLLPKLISGEVDVLEAETEIRGGFQ